MAPQPKKIKKGDGWELRFDESAKGEHEQLDELVAKDPEHVHLESMGSNWCLIVKAKDGTEINLTLYGRKDMAKGFVFELSRPKIKTRIYKAMYVIEARNAYGEWHFVSEHRGIQAAKRTARRVSNMNNWATRILEQRLSGVFAPTNGNVIRHAP